MLAAAERLRRREEFSATVRSGRRVARGGVVVHLMTRSAVAAAAANPSVLDGTAADDDGADDNQIPVSGSGQHPGSRAGFVVSKAVGPAVVRNRVRRRLRHLVRAQLAALPAGTDLVVRALPIAATRTYRELDADLAQALAAASRPRNPR